MCPQCVCSPHKWFLRCRSLQIMCLLNRMLENGGNVFWGRAVLVVICIKSLHRTQTRVVTSPLLGCNPEVTLIAPLRP